VLIVYKVPLLDSSNLDFVVVVVAFFGYKFASSSEYLELFIQSGSSILFHNQYSYV